MYFFVQASVHFAAAGGELVNAELTQGLATSTQSKKLVLQCSMAQYIFKQTVGTVEGQTMSPSLMDREC